MLTVIVLLPVLAAAVLAVCRPLTRTAPVLWLAVTVLELVLVVTATATVLPLRPGELGLEERSLALPGLGVSWHLGVDGFSLPLLLLTALLFAVAALWVLAEQHRPRQQAALYLFLEATCLGAFTAQDLIVFFLWFDLSIVAMAFSIGQWGHGNRRRSALVFFLYTFAGSIALLVGFIGLALGSPARSFDMVDLARTGFTGGPIAAAVILTAILVGLAIKTPTIPFHSWLPPAHTDAPTIGSVILAGVLLKLGTYGFVRIAMPLLPDTWRAFAWVVLVLGIVSALWGALVALTQTDLKRLIAFTSINHMGYIVLAVGAAGIGAGVAAQRIAITGAMVQMVSHGLTTGALFLLAGILRDRAGTYRIDRFGGLAGPAPRFAAATAVAAFASLGIPALSGFVAELQIFTGSIGTTWWAAAALPGIVITAALLLHAFQRVFTGPPTAMAAGFRDLSARETTAVVALLAASLAIGVAPGPLLALIAPAANHLAAVLAVP
jgi:NADH-quinone oxidoreductase subunit M